MVKRQFDGFNIDAVLREIGKGSLETMTRAQVETAVANHIQPMEPTDNETRKLLAALLLLALFGIKAKGQRLTLIQLAEARAAAEASLAERLDVLLNGAEIDTDAPPSPDIRNPNLPPSSHTDTEGDPITGLNAGGVTIIALMTIAAISAVKAAGDRLTYAAIKREFAKEAAKRAKERARVIAETEAARGASVGEVLAVAKGKPVSKTWLRTTSDSPRIIHLDQVGVTVPYDDIFPDGSFWSNQLPYCKCGIEVRYE